MVEQIFVDAFLIMARKFVEKNNIFSQMENPPSRSLSAGSSFEGGGFSLWRLRRAEMMVEQIFVDAFLIMALSEFVRRCYFSSFCLSEWEDGGGIFAQVLRMSEVAGNY